MATTQDEDHSGTGELNDVLIVIKSFDDGNHDGKSGGDAQPKPTDRISFSWQSSPPQEVGIALLCQ